MESIESLLQEWEKVAPKATDEVAEFVPIYGYVPFCNIKGATSPPALREPLPFLERPCNVTANTPYKHQFTVQILIDR